MIRDEIEGLLRRFSPRNDGLKTHVRHCEDDEGGRSNLRGD